MPELSLVISDPEIMGGALVFRRTRIPVHQIAELVAQGASEAELLGDYPRLSPEMIRLAPLMTKIRLNLRVSEQLNKELEEIAESTGSNLTEVFRQALALMKIAHQAHPTRRRWPTPRPGFRSIEARYRAKSASCRSRPIKQETPYGTAFIHHPC